MSRIHPDVRIVTGKGFVRTPRFRPPANSSVYKQRGGRFPRPIETKKDPNGDAIMFANRDQCRRKGLLVKDSFGKPEFYEELRQDELENPHLFKCEIPFHLDPKFAILDLGLKAKRFTGKSEKSPPLKISLPPSKSEIQTQQPARDKDYLRIVWTIFRKISVPNKKEILRLQKSMLEEELQKCPGPFSVNPEKIRMFLLLFFQNKTLRPLLKELNPFEEVFVSILLLKKDYRFMKADHVSFSEMQVIETQKRKEHFVKFILKRLIKKMARRRETWFFGPKNREALDIMTKIFFECSPSKDRKHVLFGVWDESKQLFRQRRKSTITRLRVEMIESRKNRLDMLFELLKTNLRFRDFLTPERLKGLCGEMFIEYKRKELVNLVDTFVQDLESRFCFNETNLLKMFNADFDKWRQDPSLRKRNKHNCSVRKVPGEAGAVIRDFSDYCTTLFRKKKFKIPWTYGEFVQSSRMIAKAMFN